MSETLVEVTRGTVVESIHKGDIAVVNAQGRLLHQLGNPDKITYLRSCAKPFQAIPFVRSGAAQRLGFSAAELAIACASHYAEPYHLKTVESMLAKSGLRPEHILGGIVTSLKPSYALELARQQVELSPLYSDCSGKHAAMLAACIDQGYPLDSYLSETHPLQEKILEAVATFCEYDKAAIAIGVDGCSVPVHALPLRNIALGYAQLADPSRLSSSDQYAANTLFDAMLAHPEMLSGTGGFCSALTGVNNSPIIGKIGAEGIYCVGIREKGIGIAMKMEAGNMAMLTPAVMEILRQLEYVDQTSFEALAHYHTRNSLNDVGTVVGEIRPSFKLLSS